MNCEKRRFRGKQVPSEGLECSSSVEDCTAILVLRCLVSAALGTISTTNKDTVVVFVVLRPCSLRAFG